MRSGKLVLLGAARGAHLARHETDEALGEPAELPRGALPHRLRARQLLRRRLSGHFHLWLARHAGQCTLFTNL